MTAFIKSHLILWTKALALSAVALLTPIKVVAITAIVLAVLDCAMGCLAARKRGEKITSAALRRTPLKMGTYLAALVIGALAQPMFGDGLPIAKLIGAAIALSECKSLLENLDEVSGTDVFKALLGRLGSANDRKDDQ